MKNSKKLSKIASAAFFLIFFARLSAEDMQIVFPKNANIGDTIEIKYIFNSKENFLEDCLSAKNLDGNSSEKYGNSENKKNGENSENTKKITRIELSSGSSIFEAQKNNFAVKEIFLEKINSDCTLSLKIVPWKAGYLTISPFDLFSLIQETKNSGQKINTQKFMIKLKPVPINSLAEKTSVSDFRPQAAPETLPGTMIFLAVRIGIYIFLIFAAVFAMLKIPAAAKIIENFTYFFSLKKNSRKTAKKLKKLLSSSKEIRADKDFAQNLQNILRDFLGKRFSNDFSAVSTNAIYQEFENLLGGEFADFQEEAIENLIEVFFRTDFVRYSPESAFQNGEREKIILKSLKILRLFDTTEDKRKDKNEKIQEEEMNYDF